MPKTTHTKFADVEGYQEFNPSAWDEPGMIFCSVCGAKNRSDHDWLVKITCKPQVEIDAAQAALGVFLKRFCMSPADCDVSLQNHKYMCPACRPKSKSKRKARKPKGTVDTSDPSYNCVF